MNYTTANLHVDSVMESLLNQGRIRISYALSNDYENIFKIPGLSRRSARPLPPNQITIPVEWQLLMEDWVKMCLDDSLQEVDREIPDDMSCIQEIMEHGMPARLDLASWPGRILLNIIAERFPFESFKECLCEWQPWMGTDPILFQKVTGRQHVVNVAFVGVAQPSRLVWAPMIRRKASLSLGPGVVRQIEKTIRNAEAALAALARRIARQVGFSVVYQYAAPSAEERGYGILTRKQIGCAVREILGDEWFDLPFDVDSSLRNWSEDDVLKPDAEIRGRDVFVDGLWRSFVQWSHSSRA